MQGDGGVEGLKLGRIMSRPGNNGMLLPDAACPSSASNLADYNNPAVMALFRGAPLGLPQTHKNVFEPRGGMSYRVGAKTIVKASAGIFHNRVTLNDSLLLGGNPPFQPQVSVSNGSAGNPRAAGGAHTPPFNLAALPPG